MDKIEQEYIPFGDEWAKEVKKNSKDVIIEMLRKVCMESRELRSEVIEECKGVIHERADYLRTPENLTRNNEALIIHELLDQLKQKG